jgi:hypothetical protein
MASHLDLRRKAFTVAVTIVAILVWGSDVGAQTKKTPSPSTSTTSGNASWDQAISVLQAQIDQQAAAIAQLQAALGGETTARQQADTTLQNNVNSEVIARQAADGSMQGGLVGEVAARKQGDLDTLAAAQQFYDTAVASETAARQAADTALQTNLNNEAAARQQGDAGTLTAANHYTDTALASETTARQLGDTTTLTAANLYTDTAFSNEAAARQSGDTTLQAHIDAIQLTGGGGGSVPQQLLDLASYLSVDLNPINGLAGPNVILTGVNLHIRNGQPKQYDRSAPTFDTASYATNGRGNLIVGYNDDFGYSFINSMRGGSHNIIVGDLHRYTASGGFLAGFGNDVEANAAAIGGGYSNAAWGFASTVSAGSTNFGSGQFSSVSGGQDNVADGDTASVAGGVSNEAGGSYSAVSGGAGNTATGFASSVSGGSGQTASVDYSTAP